MAFTQTPAEATDKIKRIPILGGQTLSSDVQDSNSYAGQRYWNCYPKKIKLENTDDKWVLTKVPAWIEENRSFSNSLNTDYITCVSDDGFYIWKGKRLYSTAISPNLVYTPSDNYLVSSMFKVINASSTDLLYAGMLYNNSTGNTHSYTWNATSSTFTLSAAIANTSISSGYPAPKNASVFLNGRLFVVGTGSRIYNSGPGAYTTWDSTEYKVPETSGDELVAIITYKNHIVAFSGSSIEFFYDNANETGSPLERQTSYTQRFGIRNPLNVVAVGDTVYFLSWEDRTGYGVYTLDNFQVVRVSNLYIDTILNNTDVVYGYPHLTSFEVADLFGDLCLIMYRGVIGSFRGLIAYSSKQRVWFEMDVPDSLQSSGGLTFFTWVQNATLPEWITYCVVNGAYTSSNVMLYYLSKDYTPAVSVTAEYVEDITDFGSQAYKHFKSIYFVGDPGNNTVELSWTPYMDYSNLETLLGN
jgi:hypothetical protein